jgi:2,4-dienoyl-CoA reductase-like NADH-dependent reductase (Old Yellow Enzyme family)
MNRRKYDSEIVGERSKNIGLDYPIWIGDRKVPNRMVHQPMECNDSLGGFPSKLTLNRYRGLAEAKAGITIVEATAVVSSSLSRLHQLIADEKHRKGIEKLTTEFEKINQDTILCYQLTHSGQVSDPRFSDVVRFYDVKDSSNTVGRKLEIEEIKQIREAFIKGAEIVHDSGADMVDVKFCHGYLGNQILRPANTRDDEYGGSLSNRIRFAKEVIEGIKERISDSHFQVMTRFSVYEGTSALDGRPMTGGVGTKGPESSEFNSYEPHEMLKTLAQCGVDIINISGGSVSPVKTPEGFEIDNPKSYLKYHHIDLAKGVKDLNLDVPIICSGFSVFGKDIRRIGNNSISYGYTDMVGIGRQALADPDTQRILNGDAKYCVRCRGCNELLAGQMPVGCVHYDTLYMLMRDSNRLHFTAPRR